MEKQTNFLNARLNYTINGNGPAIVLLHGFLEDLSIWTDFVPPLSKNYKVVTIDLPGFGKSGMIAEVHSMQMMASAVDHVMKQENIERCILVGHSMGGYVALSFANQFPEKLNGIILFHSQAAADDDAGKINRNRAIEVVNKNHKDYITAFIPLLFAEENVDKFKEEITELQFFSSKTSPNGIVASLAGMRDREDSFELLKRLNVPVLFIIGKQDSRVPLDKIMPQLELPKNCEALILDRVGHMGFIEAKNLTYMALEHFAERNS